MTHLKLIASLTLLIPLLGLLGCEKRNMSQTSTFQEESCGHVLMIAIDLSGSFSQRMSEQGKAYEFILQAIDRYFRDRIGEQDQVVLTQLSGNQTPLLWQGTTQQLRRDFPNPETFRDYLHDHADGNGSRINDGVSESLDYVLNIPDVARGNAKVVSLVLSDMEDNHADASASESRLLKSLTDFARKGVIGIYFCSQNRLQAVRNMIDQAGFRMYALECDIHGNPPLPSFE